MAATVINDVLERLTGRRFMRRPVKKPPAPEVLHEIEPEADEILRQSVGWTMTGLLQQWSTWSATRYIAANRIPGAFVECGVWRGGQAQIAARTLMAANDTSRDIYMYDTYEGMPPPTAKDFDLHTGDAAETMLASDRRLNAGGVEFTIACVADLADVTAGMRQTGYPMEHVHFVQGRVEDTIPRVAPAHIAFLRLDTDWYESTRHELEHLWPRLVPNGVLVVDDYDHWAGARQATDEFLAGLAFKPLPVRPGFGRLFVKPAEEMGFVKPRALRSL